MVSSSHCVRHCAILAVLLPPVYMGTYGEEGSVMAPGGCCAVYEKEWVVTQVESEDNLEAEDPAFEILPVFGD